LESLKKKWRLKKITQRMAVSEFRFDDYSNNGRRLASALSAGLTHKLAHTLARWLVA
jgi:hypothetical protein